LFPTEHTNTDLLVVKHIQKCPLQSCQTCSGARSAYSLAIAGLFLGVKRSGRVKLNPHLHLVFMLKNEWNHTCTSPTYLHGVNGGLHHAFVFHNVCLNIVLPPTPKLHKIFSNFNFLRACYMFCISYSPYLTISGGGYRLRLPCILKLLILHIIWTAVPVLYLDIGELRTPVFLVS
jgi:hypothetical protein